MSSIEGRFNSTTWSFLSLVESALITNPVNTAIISDFYTTDIDAKRLTLHVSMFHDLLKQQGRHVRNVGDIVDILKEDASLKQLLPELTKAVRLILTVPVTTCAAERSSSALRRLKTYLRSTMTQTRLNSIDVLSCHQDYVGRIDVVEAVVNEFIRRCSVRRNTFANK